MTSLERKQFEYALSHRGTCISDFFSCEDCRFKQQCTEILQQVKIKDERMPYDMFLNLKLQMIEKLMNRERDLDEIDMMLND